jgi:hypothetical protein
MTDRINKRGSKGLEDKPYIYLNGKGIIKGSKGGFLANISENT